MKIDIKMQARGSFKFRIDGVMVQFMWDIKAKPVRFLFFTRLGSSDSGGNNCAGGSTGNDGGSEQVGEEREDDDYVMPKWPDDELSEDYKDCYVLQIFGD